MKSKQIYDELLLLASNAGITVRRERLAFTRGGYCILDENKLILLNKTLPVEVQSKMLARCLGEIGIQITNMFVPTVIREYIENESEMLKKEEDVEFVIEKKNINVSS